MPGFDFSNRSTNSGRSGRGPTIDISPRRTVKNCGNSPSRSVQSHLLPGVIPGWSFDAQTAPVRASASAYNGTKVKTVKGAPSTHFNPMRFYLINTCRQSACGDRSHPLREDRCPSTAGILARERWAGSTCCLLLRWSRCLDHSKPPKYLSIRLR